ncbi:MAG: hypothetical protein KF729_00630 [Sandaracinaceae bacterium]|nr:hypothetical protein [Sandaracinaceae bacterium]
MCRAKLGVLAIAWVLAGGCSSETAEQVTATGVERTVEVGRGIGSGIAKGIRSGREGSTSTDGAQVVSTYEQLASRGSLELVVARAEGEQTVVTLRFGNDTDQPLRITHLGDAGAVLALDADEVAYPDRERPGDFTVHPRSRHTVNVAFALPLARLRNVRVWGHDLGQPEVL